MSTRRIIAALFASTLLFSASSARAQSDAETIAQLKAQVEALTKRVADLERTREPAQPPAPAAAAPAPGTAAAATTPVARSPGSVSQSAAASERVPAGPIDRALQPAASALQVSASNDSSEVAIRIGTTRSRPNTDPTGFGNATYDTLSLTASAPITDKSEKKADLGTLDGFANSAALKLRWTRFMRPIFNPAANPQTEARERAIVNRAREACRAKAHTPAETQACNGPVDDAFIAAHDPTEVDEYLSLGFPKGPSFALGLEGSIGYKKFTYFDGTTLAEQKADRVPLGAKGFISWFPNTSLTSLTGSLEYQHAFEDQKSAVLCPVAATGPVKCVNGPIGSPDTKNKLLAALEFRRQFALEGWWIPAIGIAPQATYDIIGDHAGFDLPIYVIPDAKGNLLGGVRFGYRTDTNDVAVGVFVGTAFSFRN